jgi:hypothetical protein
VLKMLYNEVFIAKVRSFFEHALYILSISTINIHIHIWIETTFKHGCYSHMNVYVDGWHWQIIHNTSLPCRIWGEALTEGLGYVMWSRTVHSHPPVMTLAASGQEQRNVSQGTILGHSWDRLTKLASLRVPDSSHAVTLSLNIRLVSVFSSALYVAVARMSHCATHIYGNATQDTSDCARLLHLCEGDCSHVLCISTRSPITSGNT